jgi:hypothetical protein
MTEQMNLEEFFSEKLGCYNEHCSIDWTGYKNVYIETKVCLNAIKSDDNCQVCHLRYRLRPL